MARIVRDAAGNIVTDPAVLASVLGAADAAKAARAPAVPVTVDVTPKASVQAEDEATTAESFGGKAVGVARDILRGEAVAKMPGWVRSLAGEDGKTGFDQARALEDARRNRGTTPEYRKLGGQGWAQSALQFASNVGADAVGILAGKVALPVEVGIQQARAAAELGASALTDVAVKARDFGIEAPSNALFGELAAKSLKQQQERGQYRTWDSVKRRTEGVSEFIKGAAFGLSPAVYSAAEAAARGEDVSDAAWETFKSFPLASIIPFAHMGRLAVLGDAPATSKGEILRTARGEEVGVNALGQKLIDKTGPLTQRLVFDAVPTERRQQVRAVGAANQAATSVSPAAENLSQALQQHNALRDIEAELADPRFAGATAHEKFAAVEGTLGTQKMQAPVLDQNSRAQAQSIGESLVQDGMDPAVAQQAIPYVLFEGVRAAKAGTLSDPMAALGAFQTQLQQMPPASRPQFVKAFEQVVKSRMQDPAFIAAADQAWSSPAGDYHWIPRSEVRKRTGYLEAQNALKAADAAANRPVFDLHVPELGELRKDYVFDLYSRLVDDLRSSPEGRQRTLQLLRSSPIARLTANPTATPEVKALAAWANQPGGARRKFVDAINRASLEISENLGVDPAVVAKHFDRYLSRSFEDSLKGNEVLGNMLQAIEDNPAFVTMTGQQRQSGRYKRKLSEPQAAKRFMDQVHAGEIDLGNALATTAANMVALSQNLHAMSELEGSLRRNGMLFDPDPATGAAPRKGLVYTGNEKAVRKGQAASDNPYNFALGKMANKWVDPYVAQALNLHVESFGAVHPLLQVFKWAKTVGNVPRYQFNNLLNDNTQMWAITGESRFSRRGRPLALEAKADIDRYAAAMAQLGPTRGVLSPDMVEARQFGLIDLDQIPLDVANLPAGAKAWAVKQAMTLSNQVIQASDPAAATNALAQGIAHLKTGAKMPWEVVQAVVSAKEGWKAADVSDAPNAISAKNVRLTSALAAAHDTLTNAAISLATSMAEQQRRLQAYKFGKRLLGLTPEQAAVLVGEAVYGVEPATAGMRRLTSHPVYQLLGPPFLNFGTWQLKKATQRALNDKNLWLTHALEQGIRAYEEEIGDDPGDTRWRSRVNEAYIRHTSAPDIGLVSGEDLADAMKEFGMPPNYVNMVRGEEGRNPYITMGLKDIGGYQSVFSNINLEKSGLESFLQFGPVAQAGAGLLDSQVRNPFRFDSGVPLGTNETIPYAVAYLGTLANLVMPTALTKVPSGIASAAAVLAGKQPMKGSGHPLHPADALTALWGPFSLHTVDQLETASGIDRRIKAKGAMMAAQAKKAETEVAQSSIPEEVKQALVQKNGVNALALIKQMELGLGWAYSGMNWHQYQTATKEVEQIRHKAVEAAEKGYPNGALLANWMQLSSIGPFVRYAQRLIQGAIE